MARNVEIKASVDDLPHLLTIVSSLASEGPTLIHQDDTFFNCDSGRLKLRTFLQGHGELIFYQRSDIQGPKESSYVITPIIEPASLRQVLTFAYGQIGRVRKQRRLFMIGRTRVHIDDVEGLGNFVELEVVLADNEDVYQGQQEALELIAKLGINDESLIECAYLDMLKSKPFL